MSQVKFRMLPIAFGIASMSLGTADAFAADIQSAAAHASTSAIEEVIITARKTEESAQVVPVSVTALSTDMLQKQAVLDVQDLRTSVPGLFITTGSQGGAPVFTIRAAKGASGVTDTVTAYVGDMPMASTRAVANMVYDMQSISVLKGPQGTLFGANATGGAIIFRPNMPSNEFEGYAQVGIGNYNRSSFQGMINVPINDVVQMRLAGEVVDRDKGFQKNLTPTNGNAEMGTDRHESLRFGLSIKPNAAFQNDLTVDYFHEDDQPYQDILVALRGPYTASGTTVDWAAAGYKVSPNSHTVSIGPSPTWNRAKIWGAVDTATYDISDTASLKAVLGYQDIRLDTFQDNDTTPKAVVNGRTADNLQRWTFEPSMDLKSDDGRFRNKTGLFFSYLKRNTGNSYTVQGLPYAVAPATAPTQSNGYYKRESRSHAIYTQFAYDLTKELTASLGLRYTWDTGKYKAENRLGFGVNFATGLATVFPIPLTSALVPGASVAQVGNFHTGYCSAPALQNPGLSAYQNFNAQACTGEQSIKSQAPSFTFTLEDKFAERSMIYATLRGSYLVGGVNNQVFTAGGFGQTYKPEKVVDFETGMKSDWDLWGRPIRTNLAVFYINYKGQQRSVNGTANGLTFIAVQNAGASTAYGLDFDGTYEVTDNLALNASWNHIESEYTAFNSALSIPNTVASVDLSGQQMAQTPKDVVNLSVTAKWPLSSNVGNVSSTLTWFWTDKTKSSDNPTYSCVPVNGFCTGPSSPAVDFRSLDILPAYDLWNFTTSWKGMMGTAFDADLWIKNLTDKKYRTGISNQMLQFGYAAAPYGHPREFGLNIRYNF